jgi:hypothetical protein
MSQRSSECLREDVFQRSDPLQLVVIFHTFFSGDGGFAAPS